jgi:hypothetical protein
MNEERSKALESGATMKTGGSNFNYVDTALLERKGLGPYKTKTKDGNNYMRIVAQNTKAPIVREIWMHSNVGQGRNTYLCLKKMFDLPCPICSYAVDLKAAGETAAVVKELDTSHRFLMFVVDTTSRETELEGAKWFDCPVSIWKEICLHSQVKRTGEWIDPSDPVDGRDIEFVRTDGKRVSYGGFNLVKTDEAIPKSWYEDLPSLEEVLLVPDPEEMLVAVTGIKPKSSATEEGGSRRESRGEPNVRGESRGDSRGGSRTETRRSSEDTEREESVKDRVEKLRAERAAQRE